MAGGAPDSGRASRRSPVPDRLHFTRGRRWVRRLRLTLAALVLVGIVAVGVALPLVVVPETRPVPGDTDAVVLLSAGEAESFVTAERVMPRGDADLLVVSRTDRTELPPQWPGCGTRADGYDIVCVEPVPATTRGEARTIAQMAAEEGWEAITLLTPTHHVSRARMLFERCVNARIEVVDASPELGSLGWVRAAAGELVALARDGLILRGC